MSGDGTIKILQAAPARAEFAAQMCDYLEALWANAQLTYSPEGNTFVRIDEHKGQGRILRSDVGTRSKQ